MIAKPLFRRGLFNNDNEIRKFQTDHFKGYVGFVDITFIEIGWVIFEVTTSEHQISRVIIYIGLLPCLSAIWAQPPWSSTFT